MTPPIWLKHPSLTNINPDETASFVEYLRWMRVKGSNETENSGTILELFREFEDNDFSEVLNRLTQRTKKIADFSFRVTCPWRIRVGGVKGVESMLLPAFDNLGIPYIPSCTLRGIAREMAKQDKQTTEADVKRIFGDIDLEKTTMGQVVFLDAYPLPRRSKNDKKKLGGVTPDMANAIWTWNGDKTPEYDNPNPNPFLSLKKSTFVIGLKRTSKCSDNTFIQVRNWLIKGLAQGIGSRTNSGYGSLRVRKDLQQHIIQKPSIIKVKFTLEGQLVHGRQIFESWDTRREKLRLRTDVEEEIRPTAFRSILRYWFRVLALGVLPNKKVRDLELELFGGIEPRQHTGLFRCEIVNSQITTRTNQATDINPPTMQGTLILRKNSLLQKLSSSEQENRTNLLRELTWLMFHLGGVGQGARRSCYCRGYEYDTRRKKNPFWRGSSLIPDTDDFWNLENNLFELKSLFQSKLQSFYSYLAEIASLEINELKLHPVGFSLNRNWAEAIDENCKILICQGKAKGNKNFALSILHTQQFKIPEVCGRVNPSIPSPVWIRHIDYLKEIDFQVVTVFGATTGRRNEFVEKLQEDKDRCLQVFPIQ